MKLDVNVLRYLSKEDFRVLTAVEMGQKNVRAGCWQHWRQQRPRQQQHRAEAAARCSHCTPLQHELVPMQLIDSISGLK